MCTIGGGVDPRILNHACAYDEDDITYLCSRWPRSEFCSDISHLDGGASLLS
jgi:hypothetical protein